MRKMAMGWVLAGICALPLSALGEDQQERAAASREASKQFGMELKAALQKAIAEGGPVSAIQVCQLKAPAIAKGISQEKGWKVARTSLKYRNPNNAPDAWEQGVLQRFEERKQAGEDVEKMEYFEVLEEGGQKSFRYMKAIPTAGLCLTCHGAVIDPALEQELESLYPQDKARGFEVGDIRGAFTIEQPM